jgi:hypothetical protein
MSAPYFFRQSFLALSGTSGVGSLHCVAVVQTQILPPRLLIDYARLCRSAKADTIPALITHLRKHLPLKWQQVYTATTSHAANIVRVERGTLEYFCDSYSELEALGEIAFDQRVRDRVIGVLGTSAPMRRRRRGSFPNGWLEVPEELDGSNRDKGHFIAHSIGVPSM